MNFVGRSEKHLSLKDAMIIYYNEKRRRGEAERQKGKNVLYFFVAYISLT
jgi:hypothetical protein